MKHITFTFTLVNLLTLSACNLNTKFDDDDYRPVGASTPVNSTTHTISESHQAAVKVEEIDQANESASSIRYIHPNTRNRVKPAKPSNSKSSNANTQNKPGSKIKANQNKQSSLKENSIKQTIMHIFKPQYGNSDIILKISKTIDIHCDKSKIKQTEKKDPKISICGYQFPEYCGSHSFSLISSNTKQLLMFHDKSYQRNIIDTIINYDQSTPGLWDKDDYVSSELLTVKQLISSKTTNTSNMGWIMNVSDNEKAQLGRSYSAAINEASKCF